MRVLIIGGGGREHAMAWRLSRSRSVKKIYCAPGNPGIARIAECIASDDYLRIAEEHRIDVTIVGPEAPLVDGVVDRFRAAGRAIVGPTQAAAKLEGSKVFAKEFMMRAGIPTARYVKVSNEAEALHELDGFSCPVVLKADGLAAGKGVVIARDRAEAQAALPGLLAINGHLVIEEFLQGEEVSFIVLTDGRRALPLAPTRDHKAVFDGDQGPNTGGMGAYCDSRILTTKEVTSAMSQAIDPAIALMAADGNPFTGFLYAGLMMTTAGIKVLEFNVRLGDPETQALMHRVNSDWGELMAAAGQCNLAGASVSWERGPSLAVVLAAEGYPGHVRSGDPIVGIEAAEKTGAVVFQAGTRKEGGQLVTGGGRVLSVTASGETLSQARETVYRAVESIQFPGMHFRRDIGLRVATL